MVGNIEMQGGLSGAHHPIPYDVPMNAPALVVGLFDSCRPPTVLRAVRTVIVNAVNGAFRWARPHIAQKGREVMQPALAYCDAPSAIVSVMRHVRVGASRLHGLPNSILASLFACAAGTVLPLEFFVQVCGITTAAKRALSNQVRTRYGLQRTARTTTQPSRLSGLRVYCSLDYRKARECLAS